MPVQKSPRNVCIGKTNQLSGFAIEHSEFLRLGNRIFDIVKMTEYPRITLLMSTQPWSFGPLDCFGLIEELETAMPILTPYLLPREVDQLTLIYNNAKYEAYNETSVTVVHD